MITDKVAEAIRAAWLNYCESLYESLYDIDDDGRYLDQGYRLMAEAAVEAMGLTKQWGHSIMGQEPCMNTSPEEAAQALRYWDEKFPEMEHYGRVWSRLVSPWVQA